MFLQRKSTTLGLGLLAWSLTALGADTVRIAYIGMLSGPFRWLVRIFSRASGVLRTW